MKTEFKILAERKYEVDLALAKLLKKAGRFCKIPVSFAWGEEFVEHKKWFDEVYGMREKYIAYRMLSVESEPVRVGDYTFIARVEFTPEKQCLVQTVPGEHVPPEYLNTDSHCDHCNSNRYRKDVFLVRGIAGDHKQVGRNCLQDFIGNDPKHLLSRFQFERELGNMMDEERDFQPRTYAFDALELLTDAATCIKLFGWVSKGMAQIKESLTPTISLVRCKDSWDPKDKKFWAEKVQPFQDEADKNLAAETIAWAKGLNSQNEYLHNLSVIFNAEYIYQPKHLGLAVSAVASFLREKQRVEELNLKSDLNKKSEWQGELKQRLRDIPVRMEAAIGLPPTEWGTSTLYKFRDEAGNVYSVITQGHFEIGVLDAGFLTGTVKKHKEYNGTKETQLSRCVVAKVCPNKQGVLNGI